MRVIVLLLVAWLSACTSVDPLTVEAESDVRFVRSDSLAQRNLPLSTFTETDGWLFLSGTLGTVPGKGFEVRGIQAETRQAMTNIQSILAAEGLGMDRVVKCTVMLADMAEWPAFNAIYKNYFTTHYPARSAFAVAGLAADARVEVECLARR